MPMTRLPSSRLFAYAAAACFFAYAAATVMDIYPGVAELSGTELFAVAKHLLVLCGIAAFLCVRPKLGSLIAVVWGVFVPFEKYSMLAIALAEGTVSEARGFPPLYVARLLLLFAGTCLSAVVAIQLNAKKPQSQSETANADA